MKEIEEELTSLNKFLKNCYNLDEDNYLIKRRDALEKMILLTK